MLFVVADEASVSAISEQTDDLFNEYYFKYLGRVDLGQEHLLKLNFRFFRSQDMMPRLIRKVDLQSE